MNRFFQQFFTAAKETPKLFFAPITGAAKGILNEYRELEKKRTSELSYRSEPRMTKTGRVGR